MPEIRHEKVRVSDLKPYPGNARKGNLDVIKESLQRNGQYRTIVVQESTGYVLAGNHTLLAAGELGWEHVDVGFIDVSDEQAKRIVLVDNRSNDLAIYDETALADLLTELPELDGTGFTDQDLNDLLARLSPGGFKKGELDMVVNLPTNPVSRPGEQIALGPHLLYCGDSIFGGFTLQEFVDMIWTDPPYLISYQVGLTANEAKELHRRTDGKEVANEDLSPEQASQFREGTVRLVRDTLKPGAAFYVHMPSGPDIAHWLIAFELNNVKVRQVLQWVKDQFVFGRSDYHYRNEAILYGWREGAAHQWYGGRSQDTVWEVDRPKRSKEHPTIKPVELAIKAIENSTAAGDVVLDPFAGSGTILAACMQTGRRALMVEVDPAYCDVIVERYERLSGEKAVRHSAEPSGTT